MSIDRGIDKDVVHIYIYNGILFSHKKNEMMPSAAMWILLETAMLSELRKRQISLTCEISKKGINELIYKTEIESQM